MICIIYRHLHINSVIDKIHTLRANLIIDSIISVSVGQKLLIAKKNTVIRSAEPSHVLIISFVY